MQTTKLLHLQRRLLRLPNPFLHLYNLDVVVTLSSFYDKGSICLLVLAPPSSRPARSTTRKTLLHLDPYRAPHTPRKERCALIYSRVGVPDTRLRAVSLSGIFFVCFWRLDHIAFFVLAANIPSA